VVFGKAAGEQVIKDIRGLPGPQRNRPKDAGEASPRDVARLDAATSGERVADVGNDCAARCRRIAGSSASPTTWRAHRRSEEIAARVQRVFIRTSEVSHGARRGARARQLIEAAMATVVSAEARKDRAARSRAPTSGARRTRTG